MKVKVKSPFFDNNGLHKRGEILDVENVDLVTMEPLVDEEKEEKSEKVEKAVKTVKKTTRKKV